jgi:ribonucleoside-diphosphate reductase alpha chain
MYRLAWECGLKTTYYLRAMAATHVEKSTLKGTDGKLNAVQIAPAAASHASEVTACSIDDPTCEACQ